MSSTSWSAGRYEAVAEQIAHIAEAVATAADRRRALRGLPVVDLACGTGSAALAAARLGAQVTGVDITPELLQIGAAKADAAGLSVQWRTADAAETGLPTGAFDAAISNMGIIFVEPQRQVAELARLLKPGAVLAFSSWVRDAVNPFFDPIVAVLGTPPATGHSPDQWGDPAVVEQRLAGDFDGVEFHRDVHTWRFDSPAAALTFVTRESPMHVDVLGRVGPAQREALMTAFGDALDQHTDSGGAVAFGSSYVVVTAVRR
ncbi:class I SAM-dependent methyltransferase [Mycolicibacterium mengxianglii]|uniref:class I SAM-dependent methyltransferase n=1 Tax=Mycolicibacterium mengxianglii TaxID=2736649 RepID=UPI0018D0EF7A|nr:class I SAM-dependent methyltransferase [Mycolicibacterium mengxianglii]